MDNHAPSDNQEQPEGDKISGWISRRIDQAKRHRQQRRAEKYHETTIDRVSRRTANATVVIGVLTLVSVGAAISQAIIFNRQLGTMQGQLAEMQAEQRPWVEIKSAGINFLKIDPATINLSLHFTLKNSGHMPATGIEIYPRLYAVTDEEFRSENEETEAACAEAARDFPARKTDLTIFPDETDDISTTPTIPTSQIPIGPLHDGRHGASFVVLGCIDYYISSNGEHGQTAFRYYIGAVGDRNNPTIPYVIYTNKGVYGPSDLILTKPMWGNYAQ